MEDVPGIGGQQFSIVLDKNWFMDLSSLKPQDRVRVKCGANTQFDCKEVVLLVYIGAGQWEVKHREGSGSGFINEKDIEEILI